MDDLKQQVKQQLKFIPFLFVGAIISFFLLGKITDDIFKQYPLIKSGEPVNSIVVENKEYKGTTLLKDAGGKKFSIRAFNWDIKPNVLYYHLVVGDSISREPYSDTLYLYKKKNGNVIEFEVQCLE